MKIHILFIIDDQLYIKLDFFYHIDVRPFISLYEILQSFLSVCQHIINYNKKERRIFILYLISTTTLLLSYPTLHVVVNFALHFLNEPFVFHCCSQITFAFIKVLHGMDSVSFCCIGIALLL